jgi:hypothetical protein
MIKLRVGDLFRLENGREIGIRDIWVDVESGETTVSVAVYQGPIRRSLRTAVVSEEMTVAQFLSQFPIQTDYGHKKIVAPFWEAVSAGEVARNIHSIPAGEYNPEVPAGTMGIIDKRCEYGSDVMVHFSQPVYRNVPATRDNLEPVLCEHCGSGRDSRQANHILPEYEMGDDENWRLEAYTPVCDEHYEEWQFMSLWSFLVKGEVPGGCYISNWESIAPKQASSITWLLQEKYGS